MGMFDSIYVKKKLPLTKELKALPIAWKDVCWQTKSLENTLGYYTISSTGKFLEHKTDGYWEPLPIDQQSKWCTHDFVQTKEWKEEVKDFHGILNFYTIENVEPDEMWWVEFDAYFIYGKLDKIVLNKYYKEVYDETQRKQLSEKIQKHMDHPWTKVKLLLNKVGWLWFWRKVISLLRIINKGTSNIVNFIQTKII